ncbi:23S rRNA (guanosine(2251)-2'-O)-methyltransferase RlmB [Mesomycoplasma molare]|uniref:23S rRNA (Guanosine(2251)-2'-O)-methyltransferase RlmB n=1 Tax=Mesomycoplasma molare TaxID=171288 RepID=A0ABY5TX19_9BACT|nr:23S rRNA (guanosine(2251)-2'-O)-methyltransferase RlmB [Mesomycoplasma molare]UWD34071.1 23S rRNA (guanosine(2251)-2'-O)-methyltransferase RlmB [Mesomycoplasma molare]
MRRFICGKNSVIDAINNNVPIIEIFTSRPEEILKITKSIKINKVNEVFLNNLVKENHQGFVAEIQKIEYYDIETIFRDKAEKILILDHIKDPHNFGAIIRTANASGLKHIIIPKDRSVDLTDTVLKVSSGGFVNMKFIKVNSISAFITRLRKEHFWIYGTTLSKNSIEIDKVNFNYPLAIIMGSESNGISKSVEKMTDQNIYIPLKGTVQSLNVSVATGIILFKLK